MSKNKFTPARRDLACFLLKSVFKECVSMNKRIKSGWAWLGVTVLILGIAIPGNSAWAAKKVSQTVFIVYDPQMKSSALKTVGIGHAPRGGRHTPAQQRLLAIRAATVSGYRDLLRASRQIRPALPAPTYSEEISGFVQGAQSVETRYFPDGKAEVEMILPIGNVADSLEGARAVFSKTGVPVCEVDKEIKIISKEEVVEIISPK